MKYAKVINSNGILERTEKRKTVLSTATEITQNEYKNLSASIEIFVGKLPAEDVLPKYWQDESGEE